MDCSNVASPNYRMLCEILAAPVSYDHENPATFTGLPATDILILQNLSDKDLNNVCTVNTYLHNLCNNESFWLNRVLHRFSVLGSGVEIREKYIPDGVSWKDYYLWLSGLLDSPIEMVRNLAFIHNREDLKILLGLEESLMGGFTVPVYIDDNLRGFLAEGNFGLSDPGNPNSPPLKDFISAIRTGVTNRAILTPLFVIYVHVNNLQDKVKRQFIIPDALMLKWFGPIFDKYPDKFPRDGFRYASFQTIAANSIIKRELLTPEQRKNADFQVIRLKTELELFTKVIKYYREHKNI